jgi:UDP-N-acetyl-D-mannosaminuronic acid dehydrogenase
MQKARVCVIGLGYIGLPTASLLANRGYEVAGVDTNEKVVETINRGEIHILEPDLDVSVKASVSSGKLVAYTEPVESDIFIICVSTPFYKKGEMFHPNLDYINSATGLIAPFVRDGNTVILESTSPVGTTEAVRDLLRESGVNTDKLYIAYCPERVLPGMIMKELVENDRIVGGIDEGSSLKVKEFYETFVMGKVMVSDSRTAEMCKLVENSYRDFNIAFANELSILCDNMGINVWELVRFANLHPRVNILNPGSGVGGHCIAVDPWFIISENPGDARLMRTAREVNTQKTTWVMEKIRSAAREFESRTRQKPRIACMGLAFKPDVDDLRESPALFITRELVADGEYDILAVEPNVENVEDIELVDYRKAVEEADIIAFLVAHRKFRGLKADPGKVTLDFCGVA